MAVVSANAWCHVRGFSCLLSRLVSSLGAGAALLSPPSIFPGVDVGGRGGLGSTSVSSIRKKRNFTYGDGTGRAVAGASLAATWSVAEGSSLFETQRREPIWQGVKKELGHGTRQAGSFVPRGNVPKWGSPVDKYFGPDFEKATSLLVLLLPKGTLSSKGPTSLNLVKEVQRVRARQRNKLKLAEKKAFLCKIWRPGYSPR